VPAEWVGFATVGDLADGDNRHCDGDKVALLILGVSATAPLIGAGADDVDGIVAGRASGAAAPRTVPDNRPGVLPRTWGGGVHVRLVPGLTAVCAPWPRAATIHKSHGVDTVPLLVGVGGCPVFRADAEVHEGDEVGRRCGGDCARAVANEGPGVLPVFDDLRSGSDERAGLVAGL